MEAPLITMLTRVKTRSSKCMFIELTTGLHGDTSVHEYLPATIHIKFEKCPFGFFPTRTDTNYSILVSVYIKRCSKSVALFKTKPSQKGKGSGLVSLYLTTRLTWPPTTVLSTIATVPSETSEPIRENKITLPNRCSCFSAVHP